MGATWAQMAETLMATGARMVVLSDEETTTQIVTRADVSFHGARARMRRRQTWHPARTGDHRTS